METGIVKLTPELLELFSGAGNTSSLVPFTREVFLLHIVIAGTTHCKTIHDIAPTLVEGTVLKMIRHPKNEYDELAIGIYNNGTHIGWVPAELNEVISHLMDAGKAFFCRVVKVQEIRKWIKIDADIFMVE